MSQTAYVLAHLAVSRARLRRAIATARDCGDSAYCTENRPFLEAIDRRITALVKCSPPLIVEIAREITNAPI